MRRSVSVLSSRAKQILSPSVLRFLHPRLRMANVSSSSSSSHTNALIHEKSPYLLQHAHNPVNWYPWTDEALSKARDDNKLIFLSVGYSTCHWCHVMERESFEDKQVAEALNASFVCIKVDREERPDIDRIYMNYVTAITQHGGWPMSVWLNPQHLSPVYGGTYYPKNHFLQVLDRLHAAWTENPSQLVQHSESVMNALQQNLIKTHVDSHISEVDDVFQTLYLRFKQRFDSRLGGFGNAPKFPRPSEIDFLLRFYHRYQDSDKGKFALKMSLTTLQRMACGGMYDHLGGGFHRYSVDELWHVPHFEKMLYDNAQLIVTYLHAYQITKDVFYKQIAVQSMQYILRDMKMSNGGGIYSAEDADSYLDDDEELKMQMAVNINIKKEGAFYIWQLKEFEALLTPNESIVLRHLYGIKPEGNCTKSARSDPHKEFAGYNVLFKETHVLKDVFHAVKDKLENVATEKLIESGNEKLYEHRCKRPRPHLDSKIICAWNGLMLSAFAVAHKVLVLGFGHDDDDDDKENDLYLNAATEIAQFVHDNMRDPKTGHLYRIFGKTDIYAFAVDYSFVIRGLLDLFEASFEPKWIQWAIELQNIQNSLFFDDEIGGYFDTVDNSKHVIMRLKEEYDGAEPCPSSIAVQNLMRLHAITKNEEFATNFGKKTLQYLDNTLKTMPFAIPAACNALDAYQNGLKQVIITCVEHPNHVGDTLDDDGDDEKTQTQKLQEIARFLQVMHGVFNPDAVCVALNANNYHDMQQTIDEMYGLYTIGKDDNHSVRAFVCRQFACKQPTSNIEEFEAQLS